MFNATYRRSLGILPILFLFLALLGGVIAAPVSEPARQLETLTQMELADEAEAGPVVPSRFQVGIARDVAVGPFEHTTDVIRTDIFLIGGKRGMEHRVGSVKIEARHLRERFDSNLGLVVYEIMGNGRFKTVHRAGRSANLSLLSYCNGHTEFATEVKLTVTPTAREIYKGYRPTTKRYFVRSGENINCDDNRAIPTPTTPVPLNGPRKPGGGRW